MMIFSILVAAVIFNAGAQMFRAAVHPNPNFRLRSLWYLPHVLVLEIAIIGLVLS